MKGPNKLVQSIHSRLPCKKKESKQVRRKVEKLSKSYKFDPEGNRGPIGPEVVVLDPWQPGHHASTKKFVDLTSSIFDLFRPTKHRKWRYQKVIKKCLVILDFDIDIDL